MRAMHELPKIGCLWGVPLGWAWLMLRRLKFTRLRYELIAHYVELLRHGQVKALPCELVTPASLLIEKVRISISTLRDGGRVSHAASNRRRACSAAPSKVVLVTSFNSATLWPNSLV